MISYQQLFRQLDEVGTLSRGKSKHRPRNDPALYGGAHPFIQTGDVKHSNFYVTSYSQTYSDKGLRQSKMWPSGTLCITIAANIADTAILSFPACFPDSIIGFTSKDGVASTAFIKYCLDTYKTQMRSISQGTTQDNLSQGKLLSLKFRIPDFETQKKIAAILSAYDDLIANNQRRITLLERMAEDIYREWFVRLRFPGHEQAKIEKGVPQGWAKRRFGDFCVLKRGYDLPDADIQDGVYPVIASTSIKAFHNQYKVEPPVITTGRSGSLGQVLFVNTKAWPLNTALYVRDFCGNSAYLVFYVLKNMELEKFNAGAGVPSLNRNHLSGVPIVVPPSELQKAFDLQLEPLWVQKDLLTRQISKLTEMRDALLPRLISGKLAVDALDIRFPASFEAASSS
jgi:type I restriction enzyme, S subunit